MLWGAGTNLILRTPGLHTGSQLRGEECSPAHARLEKLKSQLSGFLNSESTAIVHSEDIRASSLLNSMALHA